MIYLRDISLSFADQKIFEKITWTINDRGRVGLVGDNGAGKTTLLRAILGSVDLDGGTIEIPDRKRVTIGYLPQDLVEIDPVPLLEYLRQKSGIAEIEEALKQCEEALSASAADDPDHERLLKDYETAVARFQAKDGYAFEAQAKQVLAGFGFREGDFMKNCADFSGGWKMRIMLAVILLARPDIMLLDEPTNHLDTESLEWLENWLKDYPGTIVAIAHDRVFLDKIVTVIAELANRAITLYKGNYSYYLAEKERRREALKKEMELQRTEIKRIKEFVERFRYKATKASQVQSRVKMLEKFDLVREEGGGKTVTIRFPESPRSGKEVLAVRSLAKAYGDMTVFNDVNFTLYRGEKAAIVGVNGAGKSTLSRILSGEEAPTAGEVTAGLNVKMAFFSQESAQNLDYNRTIWDEVSAAGTRSNDQERRNLLGAFLFSGDDVYKPISVLSGGEKSRLALLKILLTDTNLLILDEPTNHLDLKTREIFQNALLAYQGAILIVSHDRYFLDCLVGRVFELRDGVCHEYRGNYSYFIEKRREEQTEAPAPSSPSPSSPAGQPAASQTEAGAKTPARSPHPEGASPTGERDRKPQEKTGRRPEEKGRKTKEEKRQKAEERNLIFRATSTLKQQLSAAEERIALLEAKQRENEQVLCEPEIYKDPERIKLLNQELKAIATELEDLYYIWNDLTLRIEALEESLRG
ncbi:MAG: ABC-F family ATP-binding cassette domain-containing protein [Proteobacteria bacterium]|nr:ABC-F family ATP-binding cassette domain-containing protein [Pseudomonadota bacterium]MBU2261109.1 ABC-F family ATP-binding cassette domain-containing protein [Pseudomonadota bacterium]